MGRHTDTDAQDRLYTQVHRDLSVFTDVHGSELYAQVCMNFVCRYHWRTWWAAQLHEQAGLAPVSSVPLSCCNV